MGDTPCRIWCADISWLRPSHELLLDAGERQRADRFRRREDRTRFLGGVALLKTAVAHEQGVRPDSVHVDRLCSCGDDHGAPRVAVTGLHVSVSHSGDKVVVGVTRAGPVGVDVEQRGRRGALPGRLEVLAEEETMRDTADLLTYWCRKESVLKATGDGLAVSPRQVVVSSPSEPAALVSYQGVPLAARMTDLSLGPGYAGAVTVLTDAAISYELLDPQTAADPPAVRRVAVGAGSDRSEFEAARLGG